MEVHSQNIELSVNDIEGLAKFAQEKKCFTVVGPEDPLAAGIVDAFIEKGLPSIWTNSKCCTVRIK